MKKTVLEKHKFKCLVSVHVSAFTKEQKKIYMCIEFNKVLIGIKLFPFMYTLSVDP